MIKEAVGTGATIEEAQAAAVLQLDAPMNADVQIEVITFPEKKKFGLFGGKAAEVKAFYEVEDEKPAEKKISKPQPTKKKASKPAKTQEKKEEPKVFETVSIDECPETVKKAYEYLKTVVEGIGVTTFDIEVNKNEKEFYFNVTSDEDYSILIGRRGETLDSIQYLVRLVANKGKEENSFSKISVNIGNYRQKRETTLKEIARKTASKVRKYGRSISLDPMNPYERRIIHTEISEIEDVISYSVGEDADRKVIIALAEGVKPTQPRKNSYGGNRGGYNKSRGGRNNAPKNNSVDAPSRAPRSDAEGLSRYGKIEPKA